MMSGGDLDGDMFTVLWDKSLAPQMLYPPMDYAQHRRVEAKESVAFNDLIEFFVQYMGNDALGRIANLWLAHQ
jgi:hypothetical protein